VVTNQLRRVYLSGKRLRNAAAETTALAGIDLQVQQGEIHGLLGPNGAGKSTLCKVLSTVLLPTSGRAWVLGRDVALDTRAVQSLIGIVFGGDRGLYGRLTAVQNLRYWAALYGLTDKLARHRTYALLERVGLADRASDRVEAFSLGMKQRLHLARGLIGEPRVLLLDEPTNALDPVAVREVRELIRESASDRTILLTTHDMVEAESLCDRVTLMDRGRIIATESPRTLATWISRYERIDIANAPASVVSEIRRMSGVGDVVTLPTGGLRIETTESGVASLVLRRLVDAGVSSLRTSLPSLEEVYLQLLEHRGIGV
jgi:ABC-2 type transport system ATP-binding protein